MTVSHFMQKCCWPGGFLAGMPGSWWDIVLPQQTGVCAFRCTCQPYALPLSFPLPLVLSVMHTLTRTHTHIRIRAVRVHSFHKLLALLPPVAAPVCTSLSQEYSPHKHTVLGDYVIYNGFITIKWYLVNICLRAHMHNQSLSSLSFGTFSFESIY